MSKDQDYMQDVYDNALDLKIVGIVCAKEGTTSMSLSPGVAYTRALTEYVISKAEESEIVQKQMADREVDVFSGKRFDDDSEDSGLDFGDMISVDTDMLSDAFGVNISEDDISAMTQGYMTEISSAITTDTSAAQNAFNSTLVTMTTDMLNDYVDNNYNAMMQCAVIKMSDVETVVNTYMQSSDCQALLASLEASYLIPKDTFATMYSELLKGILQGYIGMAAVNQGTGSIPSQGTIDIPTQGTTDIPTQDTTDSTVQDGTGSDTSNDVDADTNVDSSTDENTDTSTSADTSDVAVSASTEDMTNDTDAGISTVTEGESSTDSGINTESESSTDAGINTVTESESNTENGIVADNGTTTIPDVTTQGSTSMFPQTSTELSAVLTKELVATLVPQLTGQDAIVSASEEIASVMTEAVMQKTILTKVGELTGELMGSMASAFNVDQDAIAGAFNFDLSEEELTRLMEAMTSGSVEKNADNNLLTLGYQSLDEPTSISFYFMDLDSKESFVNFLKDYNEKMEAVDEDKVINYTDITGILMSSVSTIVDSVTYVLIAFVSISLIVSSIMIGIITYISVLERTKEIGVLRAIGASKGNISSIFNAETFIVGLFSGLLGVGVTSALIPPINYIIHTLTGNTDINAVLPLVSATILTVLSIVLTLISGLIPSKQAAKKDPVLALRSE